MAKSLAQIQAQIQKLQKEADAVRAKEVAGVVAKIKVAIEHYGLTAEDLGLVASTSHKAAAKNLAKAPPKKAASTKSTAKAGAKAAAEKKPAGAPKYTDDAGHTWTGHGKRPTWFREALEAGKTAQDLLVKAPA